MSEHLRFLQPEEFLTPSGYANGALTSGDLIHVGGQIGWNAQQQFTAVSFADQFAQALDNVLAVVHSGGASAQDVASMTIYVTNLDAYRGSVRELGHVWGERFGTHYPAMALLAVAGLLEPRALVEIQAIAVVPPRRTP